MTAYERPRLRTMGEREFIFMLAAVTGSTAVGIDMTLPAFSEIRLGFGLAADSPRVALTVTLYFLGLASAQMLYGPFADRFGRKPVLYASFGIYTLGAVTSALAPTFGVLIASRFIWGIGAAGPRVLALALGRDFYEGDRLARTMAVVASIFMAVPALAPLLSQAVLSVGSWRWVMAAPTAMVLMVSLWLMRLPESLPRDRRRPLTLAHTRRAIATVFTNRLTIGSTLAIMFEYGSLAAFLGSIQLLFTDVYDRSDQLAYYFAGMSLFMAAAVFAGSRQVKRVGADRVIIVALSLLVLVATALALWSWQTGGRPTFLVWFALVTLINSLKTAVNPLIQAQAMHPMGDLAGTAAAVFGTIGMGGGAVLASFVDRAIDGSVTPLAVAYAGFSAIALTLILWARRPPPVPAISATTDRGGSAA